jgi:hypothetical protein
MSWSASRAVKEAGSAHARLDFLRYRLLSRLRHIAVTADQQLQRIACKVRGAVAAMTPLDYGVAEGVRVGREGELPPAAVGPRSSYQRG